MASFKSISNDAISVLAGWEEWNGSSWVSASAIPAAGDVVYANGFNKEIDQDWTVDQIRNDVFQGTSATGRFEILSAGITFDGERVNKTSNSRNEILYVSFGGGTSTVNGGATTTGDSGNNGELLAATIIEGQSGGRLVIETTGNIAPDTSNECGISISCINNGNNFIIDITTVNGHPVTVSDNRIGAGMLVDGSFYTVNILGVASPLDEDRSTALWIRGTGNTVNLLGSALPVGVSATSSQAIIDTAGSNTINVYGTASGNQFGSSIIVNGNGAYPRTANSTIVVLKAASTIVNNENFNAIVCDKMQIDDAVDGDVQWQLKTPTSANRSLYTAGLLTGYPLEADVEDGVLYGPSDEFEGTLSPVNVDTAQLASDLLDDIQTSSHVVAQRLRAAATDDSVGSIVTSTLGAP